MRAGGHSWNTETLTRAALLCAALVLILALLAPVISAVLFPPSPVPEPAETARPAPGASLVLLGSGADPLCAALTSALEDFCAGNNWRLVTYDCKGDPVSQKGQIEDFLRRETGDIAVVFSVLEQKDLDDKVKDLAAQCAVVTVGQGVSASRRRYVAAHVGTDEETRLEVLAKHLKENVKKGQGALLLTEEPDKAAEERYKKGFSREKLELLGNNYTWGGAAYAQRYLDTALDQIEDVGAVVCTSRHGTVGAWNTLGEKDLRDSVQIAALFWDPAMADDLATGQLDAAVAVSAKEAAEKLVQALPKVLKKEQVEELSLTPVVLTPETIGETDPEDWVRG